MSVACVRMCYRVSGGDGGVCVSGIEGKQEGGGNWCQPDWSCHRRGNQFNNTHTQSPTVVIRLWTMHKGVKLSPISWPEPLKSTLSLLYLSFHSHALYYKPNPLECPRKYNTNQSAYLKHPLAVLRLVLLQFWQFNVCGSPYRLHIRGGRGVWTNCVLACTTLWWQIHTPPLPLTLQHLHSHTVLITHTGKALVLCSEQQWCALRRTTLSPLTQSQESNVGILPFYNTLIHAHMYVSHILYIYL